MGQVDGGIVGGLRAAPSLFIMQYYVASKQVHG